MIQRVETTMQQGFVPDVRRAMPIDKLLEWAYVRQRADMVVGMGAGLHRGEAAVDGIELAASSTCGCASVARIAELGCRVDSAGGPAGHLHVDAERLHEVVMQLSKPLAMLVIRHAKSTNTPDAMLRAVVRAKPAMNGRGTPQVRFDTWDRGRNYGWCPVEWTISLARIEAARMEFALWWDAIVWVARQVEGGTLSSYRATSPSVAREPWAYPSQKLDNTQIH